MLDNNVGDINAVEQKGDLSDKLLPCPFCGEAGVVDGEYRAGCSNIAREGNPGCPMAPKSYPHPAWVQGAILNWNTRAPSKELRDIKKELLASNKGAALNAKVNYLLVNEKQALKEQLTTTQQAFDQLKKDNAELEESLSALTNKLGDNCCACSSDKIEDVCMAHTPKLKQTQQSLDRAVKALEWMIAEFDPKLMRPDCCDCNRKDAGAKLVHSNAKAALASIKE